MFATSLLRCLIFLLVALQSLLPNNLIFPLDRRLSSLLGALLSILVSLLDYGDISGVLKAAGLAIDVSVLVLLTSTMVLNFLLLRQDILHGCLSQIQDWIMNHSNAGFWAVSAIAFSFSPIFMNDGLCLLLVHPVLDAFGQLRRPSSSNPSHENVSLMERKYFLLTIACSANIGSACTYTGNPQNIIIGESVEGDLSFGSFYLLMIIPSTLCWLLSTGYLNACRKKIGSHRLPFSSSPERDEDLEMTELIGSPAKMIENDLPSDNEHDVHLSQEGSISPPANGPASSPLDDMTSPSSPPTPSAPPSPRKERAIGDSPWLVASWISLLVAMELSGRVSVTAAYLLVAVLSVSSVLLSNYYLQVARTRSPSTAQRLVAEISCFTQDLFHDLDYNILFIFMGLFVVSDSFLQTGLPSLLWSCLSSNQKPLNLRSPPLVALTSVYVIVASQLIGNVPVVFMAREDLLAPVPDEQDVRNRVFAAVLLSWVSTIAGADLVLCVFSSHTLHSSLTTTR